MMMMENDYKRDTGRHFEFSPERKDNLNMLVLDLSRKKRVTLPEVRANQTIDSSHTLPVNAKKRQTNFLYEDTTRTQTQKTPVAGSNAMLSPCLTESDAKKVKTESTDYYGSNDQLKHIATLRNMHDITPGVTMVTPQQPSLPVFSNEVTNIPIAIPIPYMESSQSFVTNNEARRKFSVLVECSTSTDVKSPTSSLDTTKKTPRPFKAYPNNFLSAVPTIDHNSNEEYAKFRQQVLEKVKRIHGTISNPKMRRMSKSPGLPTSTVDEKDAAYWERRRKNNEAAKRSRDARRAKEDELAIRTTFLEHENARLKYELSIKEALLYNCNCNLPALPH